MTFSKKTRLCRVSEMRYRNFNRKFCCIMSNQKEWRSKLEGDIKSLKF